MSRKRYELTTKDAAGEDHKILVIQHGGEEGWELFLDLVAHVGNAFGSLVESSKKAVEQFRAVKDELGEEDSIGVNIEDVDVSMMAKGFGELSESLLRQRGSKNIFKRLFKHTWRDGIRFDPGMSAKPDEAWTINQTFGGNYMEMISISAFVMLVNYPNLFAGTLPNVGAMVAAVKS